LHTEAAIALGKLKDRRAIPTLLNMLYENPDPRRAAGEALEAITGQKFGSDAAKWQAWWEGEKK
jgi:HEAT repeat protein